MTTLSRIQTDAIEKMTTKDAIVFLNAIDSKFPKADKIFTNNTISYVDKKFNKMMTIELTLQVFEDKKETRFLAKFNRAIEWGCSNGVQFIEMCSEDFNTELRFQKKYNEIA